MIQVLPHIRQLGTYSPPWTGLERRDFLRLDLNECTQPLPQAAAEAIQADLATVPLYPDYQAFLPTLAEYAGLPAEFLLVANGSDQGIEIILRAFLAPGDAMAIARPEFPMFGQIAGVLNVRIDGVPYTRDLSFPYDEFRDAITDETRLAVVINPNNPTGTPVRLDYIEDLLRDFPNTPFLVDEAYFEFTGSTAINWVPKYENLMVLRTFSKAFAMAGLRLGYVAAPPDLIREFEKIRGPFDVNCLALSAAAAQIHDSAEMAARTAEVMSECKPFVEQFLQSRDVTFFRGAANFFLVESPRRDAAVEFLKANGILVRPMTAEPLKTMFRMSLGTMPEMQRFAETFGRFLDEG